MFKPPTVGTQNTTWIPMAHYTWSWNGSAEKQSGVWQLISGNGQSNPDLEKNYIEHPEWSRVIPVGYFAFVGQ